MNIFVMALSVVAIGIITVLINKKVDNKGRLRMVLAILFILYISMFVIIGLIKD